MFLVTGGSGGLGEHLVRILYQHNAKVYMAARSEEKMAAAGARIRAAVPESKGELVQLRLDLADLGTIKASAETFLAAETRLDVLWLNAGVMVPPQGSTTAQGFELQLGTNNLGHFLFVRYLHDILRTTARSAPACSVRIVWVSSSAAQMAPKPPIDFDNIDYMKKDESAQTKYMRSKAGNAVHSCEFARRFKDDGILSLVCACCCRPFDPIH